jgi:hypothetical protein
MVRQNGWKFLREYERMAFMVRSWNNCPQLSTLFPLNYILKADHPREAKTSSARNRRNRKQNTRTNEYGQQLVDENTGLSDDSSM